MPRISSRTAVAALTVAALAAVGVLAFQASGSTPEKTARKRPGQTSSAQPTGSPSAKPTKAPPVPNASGTGKRVVYALTAKRVWLVDGDGEVRRTYPVVPSTVSPAPGTYAVTARNTNITGSDGTPVEHVVLFGSFAGTVIGFSAAQDGSLPTPDPSKKTGGIRQKRADAAALWQFAGIGAKVVVVP